MLSGKYLLRRHSAPGIFCVSAGRRGRCIKPAPSLVPRQLPNPVAVVGFQKGGHAFKNLICVQAPDHDGRGCMHHKRHEKRQRQDDAPDADQVHFDDEKCVPAAADDAVIGGHLISHTDADDTQDDEKSICHFLCGRLQIVDREDRDTDENSVMPDSTPMHKNRRCSSLE